MNIMMTEVTVVTVDDGGNDRRDGNGADSDGDRMMMNG